MTRLRHRPGAPKPRAGRLSSRWRRGLAVERLEDRCLPALPPQPLTLADPAYWGATANSYSGSPALSPDGQLVAFTSLATNIVPGAAVPPDPFGTLPAQLYVRNLATGRTDLVSVSRTGSGGGSGLSYNPVFSGDGRFLLFLSTATDLTATPVNTVSQRHVYVRDLQTGATRAVDVNALGTAVGNRFADFVSISPDGRYVAFQSDSTDLVAGDDNNQADLFLRDLQAGVTVRLTTNPNSPTMRGVAGPAQFTADGRFLVFATSVPLVAADQNGLTDVYRYDLQAGTFALVSATAAGAAGNGLSDQFAVSGDGRVVAFRSAATDLTATPTTLRQVFVRDLPTGTTTAVILSPNAAANGELSEPQLSRDGRSLTLLYQRVTIFPPPGVPANGVYRVDLPTGAVTAVTVAPDGTTPANGGSDLLGASADGRFVAFSSTADNLAAGDANNFRDVFVRDLAAGVTRLVSRGPGGASGDAPSPEVATSYPGFYTGVIPFSMSADGARVAYQTYADNLVAGDNNRRADALVYDWATGANTAASAPAPALATGYTSTGDPAFNRVGTRLLELTPDGRFVLFVSSSPDLTPNPYSGDFTSQLYLRDWQAGTTELVSLNVAGDNILGRPVGAAHITPDGRFVVYDDGQHVYVRDRQAGTTRLVDATPAGAAGNDKAGAAVISADGRYVAFRSRASDLVPGYVNGNPNFAVSLGDIYWRDLQTGETRLVTRNTAGTASGNGAYGEPRISADGRSVIFSGSANNLVAGDNNGDRDDVFVYDAQANALRLVSVNRAGTGTGNSNSQLQDISADGRFVAFRSDATDLVSQPVPDGFAQIYVRDIVAGTTQLVTVKADGSGGSATGGDGAVLSSTGRYVLFTGLSNDLVSGIKVTTAGLYLRDLQTGQTRLVSVNAAGTDSGNGFLVSDAATYAVSADGRFVAFTNRSTDLVTGVTVLPNSFNVYFRDVQAGTTTLLSRNATGTGAAAVTSFGVLRLGMAADGSVVLFDHDAPNLYAVDINGAADVFAVRTAAGTAQIRGTVFADANGDGARQGGEAGQTGVTVYLDGNGNGQPDAGEPRAATDAAGGYALTGLDVGQYTVRQVVPTGFGQTLPAGGAGRAVAVTADGQVIDGQDFGNAPQAPDLVVAAVAGPDSATPGQSVTVSWQVRNNGTGVAGARQDAVYISADQTLDAGDTQVAVVTRPGPLAPQGVDAITATVTLPALPPRSFYFIVQADRRYAVAERDESNNLAASARPTALDVPELTIGSSVTGRFAAPGEVHYYRVVSTGLQVVRLNLDLQGAGVTALYTRAENLPTASVFDARSVQDRPDQELTFPAGLEVFYVAVAAPVLPAGSDGSYRLSAAALGLEIDTVDQAVGDRGGSITLHVTGGEFPESGLTASLEDAAGHSAGATQVRVISPAEAYVTFDLTQVPVGTYDLRLTATTYQLTLFDDGNGLGHYEYVPQSQTAVRPAAFSVQEAKADAPDLEIRSPAVARAGRFSNSPTFQVVIEFTNRGTHDLVAPLVHLTSSLPIISWGLPGEEVPSQVAEALLLLLSPQGPANIIRPGQTVRLALNSRIDDKSVTGFTDFAVAPIGRPDAAVDYAQFLRSIGLDPASAEWQPAVAVLRTAYGATWGELQGALGRQAADRWNGDGEYPSVTKLLLDTAVAGSLGGSGGPIRPFAPPQPPPPSGSMVLIPRTLEQKEQNLIVLADWFAQLGAADGADHLLRFLGPAGINFGIPNPQFGIDYADGSVVSVEAKVFDSAPVSFQSWHNLKLNGGDGRVGIKQLIEDKLRATDGANGNPFADPTPDTDKYPGETLFFYLGDPQLDIKIFSTANPIEFDLQTAFGKMDDNRDESGRGTPADNVVQVIFDQGPTVEEDECGDRIVRYTARLRHVFRDFYQWTPTHRFSPPGPNQWALDLQEAGWGTPFATSIEVVSDEFSGVVNLGHDELNHCDKFPTPDGPAKKSRTLIAAPLDPNEMVGPSGAGAGNFLRPDPVALPYTIKFENQPTATAPAQEVVVTHQLDADLDWSTFALGDIGFGGRIVSVPTGLQAFQIRVAYQNADGSPLFVDVAAALDRQTGTVTWTFRSVDPATGALPRAALDGFLPPDDQTGRGQGFINFTVEPRPGLPTGTRIDQQASIVFDANAPLATNVFTNTIDADPPTSSVTSLPATSGPSFTVHWSGSDGAGSGIASFDVFVSDNGGPFQPFRTGTADTSAVFTGQVGHTYGFYSVATDNVGLTQPTPAAVQATTTVIAPPPPPNPVPMPPHLLATGAGAGGGPHARVFNPDGSVRFEFLAYDPRFTGGVRVATADVTGDGIDDVITAPGFGGGPHVKIFDGRTGALVREFMAYDPAFRGGAWVAAADVTGDGRADIVTGAGSGGGPHVEVFDGATGRLYWSFLAYGAGFRGGVRVAAGDVTGDGVPDVVTGAGPGGGPHVEVFDGRGGQLARSFLAYTPAFRGGVFVAAGDLDGDGRADIVTGSGPLLPQPGRPADDDPVVWLAGASPVPPLGDASRVKAFRGSDLALLLDTQPYGPAFLGGARVAAVDFGGLAQVITAPGQGGGPDVRRLDGGAEVGRFLAYNPAFLGGVFVG